MEIETRVTKIIADQLGGSAETLAPGTRFIEDLNADSLDTVEMVMALEEEFDINIPEEAAAAIQTVGSAIDYVRTHSQSVSSA